MLNLSNGGLDLVRVRVFVVCVAYTPSRRPGACLYPREHIDLCMYTVAVRFAWRIQHACVYTYHIYHI